MNIRMLTGMALAALPLFTVSPCHAVFEDVLAVPSVPSPLASVRLLNGVARAGDRLVAVGQRGHIVLSDDGGKTWLQTKVPVSTDLTAVHFPSPTHGWAVGHDGIVMLSEDGGHNWAMQLDGQEAAQYVLAQANAHAKDGKPDAKELVEDAKRLVEQKADKPFLDVWFENVVTGYVVGAFNLIFRTDDGGKTWQSLYGAMDNPKRFHLNAIRGAAGELYAVGEQGLVMRFDRAKGRFVAIPLDYRGSLFGVIVKPGTVIAFGLRGNAFRSRDGKTWQKLAVGTASTITGGTVLDDGRVVLVTQAGQVLVSADDGDTFNAAKIDKPTPLAGVTSSGKDGLALVGNRGARVTVLTPAVAPGVTPTAAKQ